MEGGVEKGDNNPSTEEEIDSLKEVVSATSLHYIPSWAIWDQKLRAVNWFASGHTVGKWMGVIHPRLVLEFSRFLSVINGIEKQSPLLWQNLLTLLQLNEQI